MNEFENLGLNPTKMYIRKTTFVENASILAHTLLKYMKS